MLGISSRRGLQACSGNDRRDEQASNKEQSAAQEYSGKEIIFRRPYAVPQYPGEPKKSNSGKWNEIQSELNSVTAGGIREPDARVGRIVWQCNADDSQTAHH